MAGLDNGAVVSSARLASAEDWADLASTVPYSGEDPAAANTRKSVGGILDSSAPLTG
jgi:hypothetical protein